MGKSMVPRLLMAAFACALAACGPRGEAAKGQAPQSLAEALSCENEQGFAQTICAHPQLSVLDGQIREALIAQAGSVSDAGAQMLAESQRRWLEAQRVDCGVIDPDAAFDQEQTRCLESKFRARILEAQGAVQQVAGYTFQSVEVVRAQEVSAEAASAAGFAAEDAPHAIVRDIRYPRIDNMDTAQAARFNELVRQSPQYALEDQTEESVSYQIVYAGPEIISVKFETYENTLGAAHPETGARAVTILMTGEGRAISAADVFQADSGWEAFVTRRAVASLSERFRDYEFAPPERDVRETVTKPHLWLVTEQGLTILFPPYSFGGPRVLGGAEVSIPWSELRAYLNANAPAPIGARA